MKKPFGLLNCTYFSIFWAKFVFSWTKMIKLSFFLSFRHKLRSYLTHTAVDMETHNFLFNFIFIQESSIYNINTEWTSIYIKYSSSVSASLIFTILFHEMMNQSNFIEIIRNQNYVHNSITSNNYYIFIKS